MKGKVKDQEKDFIDQMSEQLPNVSMVDIREITKKVIGDARWVLLYA